MSPKDGTPLTSWDAWQITSLIQIQRTNEETPSYKSLCVTFEQPSLPHIALQQKGLISGSFTSFFPRIQCGKINKFGFPFLEVFAFLFFFST